MASNCAMSDVELTLFFRFVHADFNIRCHAGHLKEETRVIFSQMKLPKEE